MAAKSSSKSAKAISKGEILNQLSAKTGLKRKQLSEFFGVLADMVANGLKGPQVFALPGLVKFKLVKKPATPGGMRPNPFKPGEMMEVKPKPARNVVKAVPLKALKDMV